MLFANISLPLHAMRGQDSHQVSQSPSVWNCFHWDCKSVKCIKYAVKTVYLFLGFSVAPTPSGSYADFQLWLVEEDPAHTNIGIFACMGKTTDATQVSWKTSLHESLFPPTGAWTHAARVRVVTNQRFRPLDNGRPLGNLYCVIYIYRGFTQVV